MGRHRYQELTADGAAIFDRRIRDVLGKNYKLQAELPDAVSGEAFLGAVKNQLAYGSCSAESGCGVVEALWKKTYNTNITLSPMCLYEEERILSTAAIGGSIWQDTGERLLVTELALMKFGVCLERDDPYIAADFVRNLDPLLAEAATYRIHSGYWAPSLNEILNALALGYFVQIGIQVYPSFESPAVEKSGIVPMPTAQDLASGPLGGHALVAYGYNKQKQYVEVRNSWGDDWGLKGNCRIPFRYFVDPYLTSARVYTLAPITA